MKTLRERNQESQYRTASQGLNHYNAILKAADYETRMDLESEITRLKADVKILSNLEMTIKSEGSTELKAQVAPLIKKREKYQVDIKDYQNQLKKAKKIKQTLNGNNDKGIEIIINQYNGSTDVLLPVRESDLSVDDSLASKLYQCVSDVCDNHDAEDVFLFEGYLGVKIPGRLDKKELGKEILANAPAEFGGGKNRKDVILYLRVADNFCFTYNGGSVNTRATHEAPEVNSVVATPTSVSSNPISTPSEEKDTIDLDTITRDEAIVLLEEGVTSKQLRDRFPGTVQEARQRIPGWASNHTKGNYNALLGNMLSEGRYQQIRSQFASEFSFE